MKKDVKPKKQQDFIDCETCNRTHHKDYIHPSEGYDFRCMRCGHEWKTRAPGYMPKICASCHSAYWDRPPVRLIAVQGSGFKSPGKVRRRNKERVKATVRKERARKAKIRKAELELGIESMPSSRR